MECCICHNEIEIHRHPTTGEAVWDQGHNALPVADGRCCDTCNSENVIPSRFGQISVRARATLEGKE
jgi:hypothetical protein